MTEQYRPVDGLITRIVDDQLVLVSPTSGKVRVLNELGTTIWQALSAGRSIDAIVQEIAATYGVAPAEARTDVDHFLNDLRRRELIR